MLLKLATVLLMCIFLASGVEIERVDDTDLVHLLTGTDYVIVLFSKSNCPDCLKYERAVTQIQNELKESLGAVVVKAHDSNLVGIYDPSKEPALVFFRRGIPLLYYGDIDAEHIAEFFGDNKEPVVKELSDENFEHLTQASTGATTGDWFIFFYSADCVFCQRLYGVWESVGARLKRILTVARINRLDAGISTAKRLGVLESLSFIYLRHGKMYRYFSKDYSPKSFIEFVEKGLFKEAVAEKISAPPGFMEETFSEFKDYMGTMEIYAVPLVILLIVSLLVIIFKCVVSKSKQDSGVKKDK